MAPRQRPQRGNDIRDVVVVQSVKDLRLSPGAHHGAGYECFPMTPLVGKMAPECVAIIDVSFRLKHSSHDLAASTGRRSGESMSAGPRHPPAQPRQASLPGQRPPADAATHLERRRRQSRISPSPRTSTPPAETTTTKPPPRQPEQLGAPNAPPLANDQPATDLGGIPDPQPHRLHPPEMGRELPSAADDEEGRRAPRADEPHYDRPSRHRKSPPRATTPLPPLARRARRHRRPRRRQESG